MSDTTDFLNALFGPYKGEITFEIDTQPASAAEAIAAAEAGGAAYLIPHLSDEQACFVYGVAYDVEAAEWREFQRQPTAALFRPNDSSKSGTLLAFWAFESPFPLADVQPLYDGLGSDVDEPMPLPGANGWTLEECDPDRFYSLEELLAVYGATVDEQDAKAASDIPENVADASDIPEIVADVADQGPPWEEEERFWSTARIMTPGFDPETDPRFAAPTVIAQGPKAESAVWKTKTLPLGAVLAQMCTHTEGQKDGPGFVGGEVIGERRKAVAMKQLTFVGLDIDTGMKPADIDAVLAKLGCVAVRYTTHSNFKTESEFLKSRVVKFAQEKGYDATDISVDLLKEFMTEVGKFEAYVVDSVDDVDEDQTEKGFVVRVSHCPIPKNRIVLPLAKPFVMAKEGTVQRDAIEKWKKVPASLARELGVPIDTTGVDPSRLFYYPRHKKGRPYEVVIFGGELFDWRKLELDDPFLALGAELSGDKGGKGGRKTKTPKGQELSKWSIGHAQGFQIADVIREHAEDRIRHEDGKGIHIECPFDDGHTNAGDTDDRACLVTNAGEGVSELFMVKCMHETCSGYTNLDMLGRMITEGWFAEEVIWDETYNALAPEETAQPEAAVRIEKERKAQKELPELMAELTVDTDYDTVKTVLELAGASTPERQKMMALVTQIHRKSKLMPRKEMEAIAFKAQRENVKDSKDTFDEDEHDATWDKKRQRYIFRYNNTYNDDFAIRQCALVLQKQNEKFPRFTCATDKPVRLHEDMEGRLSYVELTATDFWTEIGKLLMFQRHSDQGDGKREYVNKDIATLLYGSAYDGVLPPSPEIIYTPLYTKKGVLLREPGWNRELNVVMANTGFEVPAVSLEPSEEEVAESLRIIREDVLGDFPFRDYSLDGRETREGSEANAIAMILTPFMRRMIDGCTPVFFIAKPTPGTGGTLLGRLPILLFDGDDGHPMSYHRNNDDEMRKALLSAVMETRSHLFFDDVTEFNSQVLLQSITSRKLGGRILGQSKNVERANTFNWIGTGNNPYIKNEMERRICRITLNAKTPDMQTRTFRHLDYPNFILANRARIVHAVLTLIQNWIAKGMPEFRERKLVSFEEWGRMVGGVIEAAWPEHGFLDNRRPASADQDHASVRQFVKWWAEFVKLAEISPKDLYQKADDAQLDIVDGANDFQKKSNFNRKLAAMDGQTFIIEDRSLIVRRGVNKEGDAVVWLAVEEKPQAEAA